MKKSILIYFCFFILITSCESDDARQPILAEEENSSELFFSEYVEGSSFNKALEIANLTGTSVNLSAGEYSIKKQSNGEGNWMGELMLSGNIANNEVYVIANESTAHPDIINNASLLKTGSPMDFNGNDAIGLFKKGVLVDVIGNFDDSEDFGKDVTLRRRPEIIEPSTTFEAGDWDLFEMDNVEDLGNY